MAFLRNKSENQRKGLQNVLRYLYNSPMIPRIVVTLLLLSLSFGMAAGLETPAVPDTSLPGVPVLSFSVEERATRSGTFLGLSYQALILDGKGQPASGVPVTLILNRGKKKEADTLFSPLTDSQGKIKGVVGILLKAGRKDFKLTTYCESLRVETSLALKAMGSGDVTWVMPPDQRGPSAWYLFEGKDPKREERQKAVLAALSEAPRTWRSVNEMLRRLNEFTGSHARMTREEVRAAAQEVIASSGGEFDFLSPDMVQALVELESRRNPFDVGSHGEVGLGQVLPETAERFAGLSTVPSRQLITLLHRRKISVEQFYRDILSDERADGYKNLYASLSYLKYLHGLFGGNRMAALAAYNCGEGRVLRACTRQGKLSPGSLPRYTRNHYLPLFLRHEKTITQNQARAQEK
jgi:soluble lytic murein transglycosylase-like protein